MGVDLILLIIIAALFTFILAVTYKGDSRVTAAAAVGLLLVLIFLFKPV